MLKLVGIVVIALALGCGSTHEGEPVEPEASQGAEAPATEGAEAPATDVPAEPIPSTGEGAEAPSAGGAAGGRMAFTTCPEERAQACTREYRPVCAEVDNGVRCVTTPCDSTDQKEFPNGCTACADAKTTGYWPVACADLGSDAR
jgi:hypothetical protein